MAENKQYVEVEAAALKMGVLICTRGEELCHSDVQRALREISSPDVVEVVHGEWLKNYMQYECTCCGLLVNERNDKPIYEMIGYSKISYCPRCGATMGGGE